MYLHYSYFNTYSFNSMRWTKRLDMWTEIILLQRSGKNSKDYCYFGTLTLIQVTLHPCGDFTTTSKCRWIPDHMKSYRSTSLSDKSVQNIGQKQYLLYTEITTSPGIFYCFRKASYHISTLWQDKNQNWHAHSFQTTSNFPLGFTVRDQIFRLFHCVGFSVFF